MNENLNLCEILKDCPKRTKLYSPLAGIVELKNIDYSAEYPINVFCNNGVGVLSFTKDGLFYSDAMDGECMLWPSKEGRTWDNFKPKKPKFDPQTLQPFDKVLAFNSVDGWNCDIFSHIERENQMAIALVGMGFSRTVIPYNEETKHLVGTTKEAPEFYRYWEEQK